MKGLKIIPMFLGLMVLTYLGMQFVEANHDDVSISLGSYYQSLPMPLGFVVLTSILIGMIVCGVLCAVELLALYVHNRRLRRRVGLLEAKIRRDNGKDAKETVIDKPAHHDPGSLHTSQ